MLNVLSMHAASLVMMLCNGLERSFTCLCRILLDQRLHLGHDLINLRLGHL